MNGYGLTETSPVIANRQLDALVPGTVGLPAPETEVKIVHPETKAEVERGNLSCVTCDV